MERLLIALPLLLLATTAWSATVDLGGGYQDHGVATPLSNHRGIVATQDGQGNDIALVWLFDHTGCYALLWIDASTGEATEYPVPFPTSGDCPFASILSSKGRFYTHYGSHFCEFDPAEKKFTFVHKTVPQMAMGMTEADDGTIWSVTYPNSAVASYNPDTGEFRDYGSVYQQNWRQYQRAVACDDTGWLYFGVGMTWSQLIALDPKTGQATPLLAENRRVKGNAYVYRDQNGKVYGHPSTANGKEGWLELYQGQATPLEAPPEKHPKPCITASQSLFWKNFPDGKLLKRLDTVEQVMTVEDPKTGESKTFEFTYQSDGAHLMGVNAAPDGSVCGGTAFPMRYFRYDPQADDWTNRPAFLQFNTITTQGDHWFVGGYTHGFLLDWDPAKPWVDTKRDTEGCNPELLYECGVTINRPHVLLPHPDGRTIVMGGTPGYGYTGGGLLFWDRETRQADLLTHEQLIPLHSTMSLAALPDGNLVGGTTIGAGTGGEVLAKVAELYLLDLATRKLTWHEPLLEGVYTYTDLCAGADGKVFGFADSKRFFVFDPAERKILHEADVTGEFGATSGGQGPRVFVKGPDGAIYVLFQKGIAKLNQETYELTLLAESPVRISVGGDYLAGRIYFGNASHLYSYTLPE